MSTNPAVILSIPKGTLKIGSDADITVIDTKKKWRVDINKFRSKSRNSPFNNWELEGKAVLTIISGEIKYGSSFTAQK
jgi:dihydroorotase